MNSVETEAQKSVMDIFTNDFSREVYETKYKYGNETVDEMQWRVARAVAAAEKKPEEWVGRFKELLNDFKFIPGGRILSNAGIGLAGTTLINCYVSGFIGEDRDSMESILDELRRQAMILKSEGGYGFCVDILRPRYSFISGIGSETPGAVKMLDMWDTQSSVITEGSGKKTGYKDAKGGIRKGAQMVTMSIWHPDIEEFITAKQTPGRLTKFNMSVLITDEFMEAVRKHLPWRLEFPDHNNDVEIPQGINTTPPTKYWSMREVYKKQWDGNLEAWKAKGYPVKIFKTYDDANELWDLITGSTYKRNEPGILFIDRVNHWNNLYWLEHINATNPSLRKGTRVLTKNGIFEINELEGKNFQVKNLRGEWQPATCKLSGKNKRLYCVKLNNGAKYYSTKEHKWPVLSHGGGFGKMTTTELRAGNLLPICEHVYQIDFEIEKKHTRDDGFMLGWLYGDGSISNVGNINQYTFVFSQFETYIGEFLLPIINAHKTNSSLLKHKKKNEFDKCGSIQVQSTEFHEYMTSVGAVDKSVMPHSVFNSGDAFIKGFIDGIYSSDGCIMSYFDKNKSPIIILSNKNQNVVHGIADILGFYGIKTTIRKQVQKNVSFPNSKKYDKEYTIYRLSVIGKNAVNFAKTFTLTHIEKQKKLTQILSYSTSKKSQNENLICVESVYPTDMYEDVWDITVYDDTHCFTLAQCITGNCGEQPLPVGGACLLGSINLTQFINEDGTGWDYNKLGENINVAVRFMDNVNDVTYVPLPGQRIELQQKRRIGLGIMGYASALVMMKIRYGSDKAIEITDELMQFITNRAYAASAILAGEKGAFPLYDEKMYIAGNFVKTLSDATKALIVKYGMRNSHLMSVQPTGTTSSFANVVSGGLEPIFRPEYVRTKIVEHWPDHVPCLANVDFANTKFDTTPAVRPVENITKWEWTKEGDENILRCTIVEKDQPAVYKYDQGRGLTKEYAVMDYGVMWLNKRGEYDKSSEYVVDTAMLSIDDHINTMAVIAKYIDSAMSKTINLPNEYSFEEFKRVYDKIYDSGVIKGCTTYRDGTMASVLSENGSTASSEQKQTRMVRTKAPKRPKVLDCDIHHLTIGGDKWLVFIGLYGEDGVQREDKDPYEVFAFKRNGIQISPKITSGKLVKVKMRNHQTRYDLELDDITIEDVCSHFKTGEESALTRMISTALRHGADMDYIYDQLMKAEGSIVSFSKAIARSIKKYVKTIHGTTCPECGAENALIMTEGCLKCTSCGASKCG